MPVMRIRCLRETVGISQASLGLQMGVGQSTVASWENEVALPKARDLPRLANVLGCTIQDLFAPEDDADEEGGEPG